MADMIALTAARALVLILEIGLALPLLYLAAVAVSAAIASWRKVHLKTPTVDTPSRRFAVLVPAYNEEALIGEVLASLAELDYPSERYAIHVIADNCSDKTAAIARACGAHVHERADTANRGKGHALAWAIARLMSGPVQYDAYVILDADSIVSPTLLRALEQGLSRGGKALQSHNAVLNATDSPTAALRWLALSLMNYIRPLGRNNWAGSSTLTGNGMCLSRELLTHHPWRAFGLSEDYQYYLELVASGERVLFIPDAEVRSVMPNTARQLQSQDIRWESLDPDASSWQRHMALRLLVYGIRLRDWVRLDAFLELIIPPFSILVGGCALAVVGSVVLGSPAEIVLAALLLGALNSYVGSAFILLRPPLGVYRALVHAPAYVVRKLWIYFVLRRLRRHNGNWVRTSRAATASRRRTLHQAQP
jgi:glycosyltransferase involved in cell wall biosynthesis